MPSKGQRGAILKDCYHQHQKHLTDPTCLSLKLQFSCLRNQNKIHDSIISCWHSLVINAIPATWELCVTLDCSLWIPNNLRQTRGTPKTTAEVHWGGCCGIPEMAETLGQWWLSLHTPSVCCPPVPGLWTEPAANSHLKSNTPGPSHPSHNMLMAN